MKKKFLSIAALLLVLVHCGEGLPESCDGAALRSLASLGEQARRIDLDGIDPPDWIIASPDRSAVLFLACGDGKVAELIRATTPLFVFPSVDGKWATIEVDAVENQWVKAGGIEYRLGFLPFASIEPSVPQFRFENGRYVNDSPLCEALDLHGPIYSSLEISDKDRRLEALTLSYAGEDRRTTTHNSYSYLIGETARRDVNADGVSDILIEFEDRHGSGAGRYADLLLGCGGGRYIHSGGFVLPSASNLRATKIVPGGLLLPAGGNSGFVGFTLDSVTSGLREVARNEDMDTVLKALETGKP